MNPALLNCYGYEGRAQNRCKISATETKVNMAETHNNNNLHASASIPGIQCERVAYAI